MWGSSLCPSQLLNNAELKNSILSCQDNITFIDGPSWCGKTYFLHELEPEGAQIIPFYEFYEALCDEIKQEKYSVASFSQKLCLKYSKPSILCFDDIDMNLRGKFHTQTEVALIVQTLAETRKLILSGIAIKERCFRLMYCLQHMIDFQYYSFVSSEA